MSAELQKYVVRLSRLDEPSVNGFLFDNSSQDTTLRTFIQVSPRSFEMLMINGHFRDDTGSVRATRLDVHFSFFRGHSAVLQVS